MPSDRTTPARVAVNVTIRKDLAEWLDEQAETRMIGKSLLVEKAVDRLKDSLEPDPLATQAARLVPPSAGSDG